MIPDALTVHRPPPPSTRCSDCPTYGCVACRTARPPGPWIELTHSVTGHRHQFPNNPAAIEGAALVGWYIDGASG